MYTQSNKRALTIKEVASLSNTTENNIRQAIKNGRLLSWKLSTIYLIDEDEAWRWISTRKIGRPKGAKNRNRKAA